MINLRIFAGFLIGIVSLQTFAIELSNNDIEATLEKIPKLIATHHVDRDKAEKIAANFAQLVKSKKYSGMSNPEELVKAVSADLKEISNDGHLYLGYTSENKVRAESKNWLAEERKLEIDLNYGFTSIQVLSGNIGYIKVAEWMHPKRSMPTAIAALKLVENTETLIIDLRGNGGGYPGIMEYILSHYFEGPPTLLSTTHYSDSKTLPHTIYSSDLLVGELRVNTPLYILIDASSASASEYFAYTLQAFGKATIVGSKSSGAANMNSYYPLNKAFRLSVSTAKPTNPITNTNWELKGVIPDIETSVDISLKNLVKKLNLQ